MPDNETMQETIDRRGNRRFRNLILSANIMLQCMRGKYKLQFPGAEVINAGYDIGYHGFVFTLADDTFSPVPLGSMIPVINETILNAESVDRVAILKEKAEGILLDGHDSALIGMDTNNRPMYSYVQLMRNLLIEFSEEQDAIDWFDYNIAGMEGETTFGILYDDFC